MRFVLTALAATTFAAHSAAAEVVEKSETHFVTRDTAKVSADPTATWLALISPGKWWNKAHTWSGDAANLSITPQGGGCFCERLPGEDTARTVGMAGSAMHMTVVQADPHKVLRMRGALGPLQSEPVDGVLTIAMKPVEGGTQISWEYVVGGTMRFEMGTISKAVDGVMSQQLAGLANLLGRVDAPSAPATAEDEATAVDEPGSVEDAIDAMGTGKSTGEGR